MQTLHASSNVWKGLFFDNILRTPFEIMLFVLIVLLRYKFTASIYFKISLKGERSYGRKGSFDLEK